MANLPGPLVLLVLDGWGIAPQSRGNAIALARTPNIEELTGNYPTMVLQAAGENVGLPWGEMGNSEVGHLTIGGGRILYQSLPRVTKAIEDGTFFTNEAFLAAIRHVQSHDSTLHLMGLVSNGGVHSFNEHCYALLELAKKQQLPRVAVHAFLDGRDTPRNSAATFLQKLQARIDELGVGTIATLGGRFYAMDRDNRWDRIARAYAAIVHGRSERTAEDAVAAVEASYREGVYDEEFPPTVLTTDGHPRVTVRDHDAVIFFNFRPDRARQLTKAFTLPSFDRFDRGEAPADLFFVSMTEYERNLPVTVAFPPEHLERTFGRVVSEAGLSQLHIAETEKYAHVTFFFNGGREDPYPKEERILIPSPQVASYDQAPEMSLVAISARMQQAIRDRTHDVIVANFANADMVGHTGNLPAIIQAVEAVDREVGLLAKAVLEANGVLLITADHGNAEQKLDLQTGVISKEHTKNPVPFIIVSRLFQGRGASTLLGGDLSKLLPAGVLSDVAPTALHFLGLPQPPEMSGRNLLPTI